MIREDLLSLLVCPDDRTSLALAEEALIERINRAILAGEVVNRAGVPLDTKLQGGLLRTDGKLLYPITDEIPCLLVDEAIPLDQLKEH